MPRKTVKRRSRCGGSGPKKLAKNILSKAKPVAESVLSEVKDVLEEVAKDQIRKTPGYITRKSMARPSIRIKPKTKPLQSTDDIHIPVIKFKTPNKTYKLPKDNTFFTPPSSTQKKHTNTYTKKKTPEPTGSAVNHYMGLTEVKKSLF